MPVPKYLSAEQYSKQSNMGVEEVKRQCRMGKIPCLITEGGYYKIPIYEDAVPKEQYEKVLQEKVELETKLKNAVAILR